MRKLIYTFLLLGIHVGLFAQLSFETLPLNGKNYWKGDSGVAGTTYFQSVSGSHFAKFRNRNDTSSLGDYWSGYAFSKLKDSTSLSYTTNDCAAITAAGHANSDVYVVAYENTFSPEYNTIILQHGIQSMYVTNSTIAYRSMQNGDGWAKKFGGASGNDPDYFRIVFQGWTGGQLLNDTVQFYLADFRDSNQANDYILKDWKKVDLGSKFYNADSITYHLESSDTNSFGMLTPAYFCIDDMTLIPLSVSETASLDGITIYPNPCSEYLQIQNELDLPSQASLYNLQGACLAQINLPALSSTKINVASLPAGHYNIHFANKKALLFTKL